MTSGRINQVAIFKRTASPVSNINTESGEQKSTIGHRPPGQSTQGVTLRVVFTQAQYKTLGKLVVPIR